MQDSETIFARHPNSPTIIWSIFNHNQLYTFKKDELKQASDIIETNCSAEQAIIIKSTNMKLPHLFSLLLDTPLIAASEVNGLFEKILLHPNLGLAIEEAESFLKILCGNFISRTEEFKIETFVQSENGITDDQVNDIFCGCPISIYFAKWILERLAPRHIIHDLIPVVESPVPYFSSYYMAWRRHATLWLFHHREESEFLFLLPNMYIESLFYIKKILPIPIKISSAIDKRLDSEVLGC